MPGARRWVKLWCYERLHGSVSYQLSESQQSIWDKILCLAGLCNMEGLIADHDGRPYPHSFIIHELHCSEDDFESTLALCKEEGRIVENEKGLDITNWERYQSEYERQKQYRRKDPDSPRDYKAGKLGHMVATSAEDVKRIQAEKERRLGPGSSG